MTKYKPIAGVQLKSMQIYKASALEDLLKCMPNHKALTMQSFIFMTSSTQNGSQYSSGQLLLCTMECDSNWQLYNISVLNNTVAGCTLYGGCYRDN